MPDYCSAIPTVVMLEVQGKVTHRVGWHKNGPHVQQVRHVVHRASCRDDIARQLACIFEELVLLVDCVYMSGGA